MTSSMVTPSSRNADSPFEESADTAKAAGVPASESAVYEARVFLVHLDPHSANFGQTLALADGLRAENWDMRIICRKSGRLGAAAEQRGIPVHFLPDEGGKSLGMAWKLLRAVRGKDAPGKAALVHACDLAASNLVSLAWRLSKKFRIVHTRRVPIMEPNPKAVRCYQTPPAKIITDSLAGKIALRLSGLEPHMLPIIPCGLDAPGYPRKEHGTGERFIFAITGDLTPANGHSVLFNALPHLEANPAMAQWEVRILGGGPLFSPLLAEAQDKNIASRLAFLTGADAARELCRCDALVLPASEGESYLPLILQGWAGGLPVVTSNRLDHAEFLQHETNCLLTQPGDAAELAEHMARLARDPGLRARLVDGGRASLRQFDLRTMVAEHKRLYREILA